MSRRYLATRWDKDNAIALCAGHHMYFTGHPLEWEVYIDELRPGLLATLKRRALAYAGRPNYDAVLAELRGRTEPPQDGAT